MFSSTTNLLRAGLLALGVSLAGAEETKIEKLEREIRELKLQKANLNKTLASTNLELETKTQALKEIREYHALFGKDIFEGGNTKLLHAVSNWEISRENLLKLETSVRNLLPVMQEYLRTAVAADPEARKLLEIRIRETEVALGHRDAPKRKIAQGTAREARIVTIDSATGTLVINAGSDAGASVGSRFRIERSGTEIGEAMVAATRPNVSGLLIQSLKDPEVPVQPGDLAKLITQ
jgi:hypothetical protein